MKIFQGFRFCLQTMASSNDQLQQQHKQQQQQQQQQHRSTSKLNLVSFLPGCRREPRRPKFTTRSQSVVETILVTKNFITNFFFNFENRSRKAFL